MKKILVCLVFWSFQITIAQSNSIIKHKVAKGETITKIAQKYGITTKEIYQLNPDARVSIAENTILVVPKKQNTTNTPTKETTINTIKHEVKAKETLYSISKQYQTSVPAIEKANTENLTQGLQIGTILNIPTTQKIIVKPTKPTKVVAPKQQPTVTSIFHEVKTKETKYGIAKQYGITIEQLEKLNPEVVSGLPIGYNLLIKGERPKPTTTLATANALPSVNTPTNLTSITTIDYTVKSKETLYSLANKFNISQDQLLALNPELQQGLVENTVIKIPANTTISNIAISNTQKPYTNLTQSVVSNGSKKRIALLLPFNLEKISQDSINSTKVRLQKDKFLNMTLDFYSGALVAIDSVKKMGLNVEVTIIDSNETKTTSNIPNIIEQYNLKNKDAIIGPFYQNNVEKLAVLLPSVPIISPLSKDYDKKYPNLIQATPLATDVKQAIFNYMQFTQGNILAVVDPKKITAKQYLQDNQPQVQMVNFNEHNNLDINHLKSLLVKDKTNYVILETENTNLILATTGALLNMMPQYTIRLVITADNPALDFEEIQISRLAKLKMLYPSTQRANYTTEADIFESTYKQKNKVVPNLFATRGFDVTFDILMRLNQQENLLDTLNHVASEQVESKFNYLQHPEGGYLNKGIYVLYYDTDLTIKEAK